VNLLEEKFFNSNRLSIFVSNNKIMNKKDKIKNTIDAIGNGVRLAYLENNPHGFSSITKVHKTIKQYTRKNKRNEIQNLLG
jgi:hypothetical protein